MRALPGALTVIALLLLGTTVHFISEKGNTRHTAARDRRVAEETRRRAELSSTRASSSERAAAAARALAESAEAQRLQAVTGREAALQKARDAAKRAERSEAARREAEAARDTSEEANHRLRAVNEAFREKSLTLEKKLAAGDAALARGAVERTALDRGLQSALGARDLLRKDLNLARLEGDRYERHLIDARNAIRVLETTLAHREKASDALERQYAALRRQRDTLDRRVQSALTAGCEIEKRLSVALVRQERAERFHGAAAEKAATLGERLVRSEQQLARVTLERHDLDRRLQSARVAEEQTRRQLNVAVLREKRAEHRRLEAEAAAKKASKAARSAEDARKIGLVQARQAEEDRESMSIQVLEMRAALKKAEADRDAALRASRKGQVMLEKEQQHRAELKKAFESARGQRQKALKEIEAQKKEAQRIGKERAAALAAAEKVEKARHTAEAQARELKAARATGLREIERLADYRRGQELLERSEDLWPSTPARVPAMERWLQEARDLLERGAAHQETLEKLRVKALPYSEEMKARDRARALKEDPITEAELPRIKEALAEAKATMDAGAVKHLNAVARDLESRLSRRRTWEFSDPAAAWQHDVLVDLQSVLRKLDPSIEEMQRRHQRATALSRKSIEEHRKAWTATLAQIADPQRSPQYRGLKLKPQIGLVPLGADPASGLQEFAHLLSGEVPQRDSGNGKLRLTPESALVLVLLPGGSFAMGASSSEKKGQPNFDPHATAAEGPVHQVKLAPFFVSKYEMTQAQWARAAGQNPSYFTPKSGYEGIPVSPLHPVEQVSWKECAEVLSRLGLALPTEAQWEYACRGSTTSIFAAGAKLTSLRGFANIADEGSKAMYPPSWACETGFRDGFAVHAPVGTFRPNAFGLLDVHGNVAEWCRDSMGDYDVAPQGEEAVRDGGGNPRLRIFRGGSYARPALEARAAARQAQSPDFRLSDLGVRPVRPVD